MIDLLGLYAEQLTWYQMSLRAVLVFFLSIGYVRIAGIRTFGKASIFDQVTALMLGAIMGRAVVSTQPFFESLLASLVLMLLHRFSGFITYKSHQVGKVLKGERILLFKEGRLKEENLAKAHITEEDIQEALHLLINEKDFNNVDAIYLERSGKLSIVKK